MTQAHANLRHRAVGALRATRRATSRCSLVPASRAVVICLLMAAIVSLAGCTAQGVKPDHASQTIAEQVIAPTLESGSASNAGPIHLEGQEPPDITPIEPVVKPGTGDFINQQVASAPTHGEPAPKGKVTFNFENQPIQAVVKAILGDLLQQNYIIAPGVQGKVTYATSQPVRTQDAMPILQTLLGWTNNSMIFKDGRYVVLPTKQAIPGNLVPQLAATQKAKGYEVRIFPLQYISPSEMQKLLTPFAPPDAFVSVDTSRSLLIMAGTPAQLANYQRTIKTFDVDWLEGMSVGIYNMQNQAVDQIMPQLDKIFGAEGESPLAGMFRFVPIAATNSIIVITPQPDYLEKAKLWLGRLDAGAAGGESGQQLYIYSVINMDAYDLAGYLNQIFNGAAPAQRRDEGGNVAPGLTTTEVGGSRNGNRNNRSNRNNNRVQQRQTTASVTPREGGPRITAVEENNQLLVLATPTQWNSIQLAAQRLDIQPLQVQIEAKILEVKLTDNFKFGVQWYLEGLIASNGGVGSEGRNQPGNQQAWALGDGGMTPSDTSTFFYSFIGNELQVALNAMQSSGNTTVLSAPSIVVTNNETATFHVGDEIPVVQTYFRPGYGSIGNNDGTGSGYNTGSVSFRQTGIDLEVTPRVNPGGLVYMDVRQEVSSPGAQTGPSGNVSISERTVETKVAVQSNQTVLLGGLIQQNDIESESGVPLLSDIPWLGRLFGATSHDITRTELLVLITPRVISNSAEAAKITREYQDRFQSLRPLRAKLEADQTSAATETDGETP